MRSRLLVVWLLLWSVSSASAHINIGFNVPSYPEFVRIPGYPVYYASQLDLNFFFYDGMYWVYQDDDWYASSWYNGPWEFVDPWDVPLFILRVPVRYYRYPPAYFYGWHHDAPPHWGEHWGSEWERHRHGWDRWDHRSAPRPAPLPLYQRGYSQDRYPYDEDEQRAIHGQYYLYHPHEEIVRERYEGHHRDHDRDRDAARNWDENRDRDRAQGADPDRGHDDRWVPQVRTSRERDKPRTDVTESQIPDQREPGVDRGRLRQEEQDQGQARPLPDEQQPQWRQQQEQQRQQTEQQAQQQQLLRQDERQRRQEQQQERQQEQSEQQERRRQEQQQKQEQLQEQREQQEQQRQLREQQAQQLQLQRRDERQRQQEQQQQEQQRQQEQLQQQELQRQWQGQQRWQNRQEQRQAPTTQPQSPRSNPDGIQAGEGASHAPTWRRGGNPDKSDAQDQ